MPDQSTLDTGSLVLTSQIFRLMVESAWDYAIFTTDTQGRVITWNAGAERVLGFREDQIVGQDVRVIFTPQDNERGRAQSEMRDALRTGQAEDRRWHLHKDGHRFWANGLMMPLRDDRKQVIGFLKIIRDRTAEKHADEARQHAESDLRLMIESATDFAIYTLTPENRVASWNSGAERLFFYHDREIIGQPGSTLFTPDDRAACVPERELKAAESMGRSEDERWHQRKDGSRFFASGVCSPIRDETGTLVGFTKVCRDITERKHAEDERDRFFSVAADLLALAGFDGHLKRVNPGWQPAFGWTPEELTSRPWLDFVHPDDREATIAETEKLFSGQETVAFENRYRAKDGSYRWLRWKARPFLEERLIYAAATDITQQKELERSLRHQARELAEADRRKDEFLTMLAHELRNPLAAIHHGVTLAQMPGAEKRLADLLGVIERQARNLSRLIDDLLDVARITQGKMELKTEPIELAPIIHRAAEAVRPLIEQRRHRLTLQLAAGPLRVEADPTRLEQIIVNLLTNAAKYSENGGHITVSAADEGAEVVIRVRDTGVGIPWEMLPKIFDLFIQVDPSLARSEGGLGIGLTLVKQLVEMHGGTTAATSDVGKGSEFTVRLPLLGSAFEPPTPSRGPEVSGQGRRVLIVDDRIDTAHLTGQLLETVGFAVRVCYDGTEAIEQAEAFRPEVILLDIGLPGMSGYDVARRLREQGCCRDTRIIAVSGYGDADARERARQAGFDHHLVKLVDIAAMIELVSSRRE